MDANERAMLADAARDAVSEADDVDAALAAIGWLDMLAAEPDATIAIVFGVLGATNATATVLDDVVVAALGREPSADRAALLPPFGTWQCSTGAGVATSRVATAAEIVVGETIVPVRDVKVEVIGGVDPAAQLQAVTITAAVGAVDADRWSNAVCLGQRAVAQQIAGATRAMLELARAHAVERVQFGRPVARFQAVRHRLAEALVAIEALDATLAAAETEPGPLTAALAKATAGRTARTVATHCQQVLAGIGFTTDHPFHRYLKRTLLLDGLFGRADDVTIAIGRELLARRTVPTLVEL